ncbi:hypothetical protein Hsw_3360 [Hymenobacter swuensis DY53]|uniref:Uncharacterized protein n=1 Tax=Hymenobacter swuensis DY53 TaxID=1227739 RepID=W8FBB2_9BACT|nr:hypothetical protein Hsw_3360 [Hymenobacter swuensis DY53]
MPTTTTTALQLCLFTTATSTAQKLRETSPSGESPRRTRRAYTRADYRYLVQHYTDGTGPQLARQLGRTLGSLKGFIRANPELRKRGRV